MNNVGKGCLVFIITFVMFMGFILFADKNSRKKNEIKLYENAIQNDTRAEYLKYLRRYPKGKYYDVIKQKDDEKCWELIVANPSIESYAWYVTQHPNGKYKEEVAYIHKKEEEKWNTDEKAWSEAKKTGKYKIYIEKYPNGIYRKDAEKEKIEQESTIEKSIAERTGTVRTIPQRPNRHRRESTSSFQARMERYNREMEQYREQRQSAERQRLEQIRKFNDDRPTSQPAPIRRNYTYQELLEMVEELEMRVEELESR